MVKSVTATKKRDTAYDLHSFARTTRHAVLLLLLHYGDVVDVVANSNIITINGGANEVQIHKTRQNGILMNIG